MDVKSVMFEAIFPFFMSETCVHCNYNHCMYGVTRNLLSSVRLTKMTNMAAENYVIWIDINNILYFLGGK